MIVVLFLLCECLALGIEPKSPSLALTQTFFASGGCPVNTVFNPVAEKCDEPENVAGCQDYYKI